MFGPCSYSMFFFIDERTASGFFLSMQFTWFLADISCPDVKHFMPLRTCFATLLIGPLQPQVLLVISQRFSELFKTDIFLAHWDPQEICYMWWFFFIKGARGRFQLGTFRLWLTFSSFSWLDIPSDSLWLSYLKIVCCNYSNSQLFCFITKTDKFLLIT